MIEGDRRKTFRRAVWILLGVVGLILLSLGGIFLDTWTKAGSALKRERGLLAERIAAVRAERALRPVFFEGDRDGNSWDPFVRALEALDAISDSDCEAFPSFQQDEHVQIKPEAAEKILAKLPPIFADLKVALQKPWTEPDYAYEQGNRIKLPSLASAMRLTKLLADAAQFRHDAGRTDESVELMILALGVGTRISVKGFVVNQMVANICANVSLDRLRSMLAEHRFTGAQLKSLRDAVELAGESRTDVMAAYRLEGLLRREMALEFCDRPDSTAKEVRPRASEFFSRRITAAGFLRWEDEMLETMERSRNLPYEERQRVLKELQKEALKTSNILRRLLMPQIARPWHNEDTLTLQFSLARISLAAALCREDRGSYPSSPRELFPTYLSEVPIDGINAKPFGYFVKDGAATVYSWGGDRDDDGGKPLPDTGVDNFDEDGDIVWTVKWREAAPK